MQAPRPPQPSPLANAYGRLLRAAASGDLGSVDGLFDQLLGLEPATLPGAAASAPPVREMLRYRGFKPAELAMLAADLKPVVKFEDIPIRQAQAFVDRFEASYVLRRSAPYLKDGLLLRSYPCAANHPDALQTIYASRGDAGVALQRLEDADPEDIRGAGALLGIPACCAEAFAQDFEQSRTDQDTLNDDACIRLFRTADPARSDARMCPLADAELLGFYPCRVDCPRALERADQVLAALERHRPGAADEAVAALSGSYLFWRLPFFARLPAALGDDGWTPTRGFEVNLFGHRSVRAVQLRFASRIAAALSAIEAIRVDVDDGAPRLIGRRASGEIISLASVSAASDVLASEPLVPTSSPTLAHFPA